MSSTDVVWSTSLAGSTSAGSNTVDVEKSGVSWNDYKLEKLLNPTGSKMMPTPGLEICLRPCVTLIFDLLTPRVDRFMS